MDFNDCVSKAELTAFITEQHNLMNELTCNVNNSVTPVEQIKQHPQSHRGDDEDADGDLSDHEDVDDDGDARNRRRYNFNRRGMRGNNHSNNDPFAKIKFSLPPFCWRFLKYTFHTANMHTNSIKYHQTLDSNSEGRGASFGLLAWANVASQGAAAP